MCKYDLFFLLAIACKRPDVRGSDWLYDRCRDVQEEPDGMLDLWAREHYKSTIITFALSIQTILCDPDVTIGIFSHSRPIAKAFLDQIKRELEGNQFLKDLFPDIIYAEPRKEAPTWSLDGGLMVKRKSNAKEKTVEAWGLVDGQPTGKHFSLLIYDDVVTRESVTTPDQMTKTTEAWELSTNLGAHGGARRFIGTRYHFNDTWGELIRRGSVKPRIHPATLDGTPEGPPAFLTAESLREKRRDQGPYTFSCQMLQNPVADSSMSFDISWLRYYHTKPRWGNWNRFLLVDPAGEKKKTNDYTVMCVIGLAPDHNYYLLDAIRDRLNLRERTDHVFRFVRKYRPRRVLYEKYGLQSDIEHIQYVQEQENYRFTILPIGGNVPKNDRIQKLQPIFEQGRFWLPTQLLFVDSEGNTRDYVQEFINDEYSAFPVPVHDDMLDCKARIVDPMAGAKFPEYEKPMYESETENPHRGNQAIMEYDVLQ